MNAIGGIYRPETRRGILSSPTAYITLSFQLVHITEYLNRPSTQNFDTVAYFPSDT